MSRRELRKSAFDTPSDSTDVGLGELDEITYGALRVASKNRVVAEGRPIKDIYPDLRQPRRAIPSAVRLATTIDPQNMHSVFGKWVRMAEKECNTSPLRVRDMVEGLTSPDDDDALLEEMPEKQFPITVMLLKVIGLAKSIKQNSLINPVTVVRTGRTFRLNTGERRWLAYHFLEWLYGSEWSQIPSHETSASVWVQAEENLSREDLGGIALARQFALLVMECYASEGKDWGQVEEFTEEVCDRPYYAQVADGNVWRIPRGMGQKIAGAMGVGESMLRHFRLMLNIPDEIWTLADDQNWSAFAVREWIADENKASRSPATPNHTVTAVTVSGEKSPISEEDMSAKTPTGTLNVYDEKTKQWVNLGAPTRELMEQVLGTNSQETDPGYSQTQYGNTWHEQFQARMAGEKSRQISQPETELELPDGYSLAKLVGGGEAFVPQTDDIAARVREASVRLAIQQIEEGISKLLQNHDVRVLNEKGFLENRTALGSVIIGAMVRESELMGQLIEAMDQTECKNFQIRLERVDRAYDELAGKLKTRLEEI